jgi:hypothetical protein
LYDRIVAPSYIPLSILNLYFKTSRALGGRNVFLPPKALEWVFKRIAVPLSLEKVPLFDIN